jgi:hypothetical protein
MLFGMVSNDGFTFHSIKWYDGNPQAVAAELLISPPEILHSFEMYEAGA